MVASCLVCGELTGVVPVPGDLLEVNDQLGVFHSPIVEPAVDVFVGYLFVAPMRHVAGFSDLTEDEAAGIGVAIARWSRALEHVGATHVYVLRIGQAVPHLHVHLVPRWPETPQEVHWTEVDQWPGARRGAADSAETVVKDLRRTVELPMPAS